MKILHVITRGDRIGGAQNHVRDLAIRLDQDGHTVDVITGARGPLTEALDAAGIATHLCRGLTREIDPLNDPRAVWELRRAIVRLEPDLVATHSSKAGTIGRIAARLAGVPCVFTAHGWPFTEGVPRGRRMLFRQTERICAPLAAALICVSDFDLELARRAGIGGTRLIRIYNGMPGNASFPRARPGQTGPMRIVSAARFDQQKDHATLLRALARTEAAVLVLAGDGPLEPELRALARDLGVADRVEGRGVGDHPREERRLGDVELGDAHARRVVGVLHQLAERLARQIDALVDGESRCAPRLGTACEQMHVGVAQRLHALDRAPGQAVGAIVVHDDPRARARNQAARVQLELAVGHGRREEQMAFAELSCFTHVDQRELRAVV